MKNKKEKKQKIKKDKRGLLKLSILDLAVYGFWSIAYIVCLFLRTKAFNTVQTSMASQGYIASYTIEVSSPLFSVLAILAKALPFVIILWTILFVVRANKGKSLCNKWIVLAVFAVNILCVLLVTADITKLHLIFFQ